VFLDLSLWMVKKTAMQIPIITVFGIYKVTHTNQQRTI